jgi:hypothetical protein
MNEVPDCSNVIVELFGEGEGLPDKSRNSLSEGNAYNQPVVSLENVGNQVQDTYMQVNNANVRLQRIEKYLGTQPKSKSKKK